MKVQVPQSIKDIKLSQFQKLMKVANEIDVKLEGEHMVEVEKIRVMTGLSYKHVQALSQKDFKDLVSKIDKALNTPCEFQQRFKMDGIEFGFHPNLDSMLTDEYMDLMNYNNKPDTLHKLMAILFRPIKESDSFGNYTIEPYEGTDEHCERMKDLSLNIVNGALVFFLNLSTELQHNIQRSLLQAALKKERKRLSFGAIGVGMVRLSNWLTMILQR